jgi:excisionase family DNA binding protein
MTDDQELALPPLLVKPADACRLLGVGETTLRELAATGRVKVRYLGTKRRFVYASLVAYAESLPTDPAGAA